MERRYNQSKKRPFFVPQNRSTLKEFTAILNEQFRFKGLTIIQKNHFEIIYPLLLTIIKNENDNLLAEKIACQIQWEKLCKKEIKPSLELVKEILIRLNLPNKQILPELKFREIKTPVDILKTNFWLFSFLGIYKNQQFNNYQELLKHPKWQRKRLEIMQRDNFTCCICHRDDIVLNVHHKKYIPNKKPWEYEDINLITLCEDCHSHEHELQKIKS